MTRPLQLCALMAVSYFIAVLNMRDVSEGSRLGLAVTDVLIASVNFTVVQRVAGAGSPREFVGYVLGGVVGAQLALECSLRGWL